MTHRRLTHRSSEPTALLTVLAILAGAVPFAAGAQQPEPAADSKFAPVKAPTLTPDMLKTPDVPDARRYRAQASHAITASALPAPKLPTDVDLGKYDLEFKAGQTSDVNPRTGFDSGETVEHAKDPAGQTGIGVTPNYFGLKLSAPTH